jgi:hypothetical protein
MKPVLADFFVTGSMRSGTTYMASILNSQERIACLEDKTWSLLAEAPKSFEHFSVLCSSIEARFIYLGIPAPDLRSACNQGEICRIYREHLLNYYSVETIGFKSTMMNLRDIQEQSSHGSKVILMRRSPESILRSWVGRISPDLEDAEYRLSCYLASINNYIIPVSLADSVYIVDYEHLVSSPVEVIDNVSTFLGKELFLPETRYHSFNKGRFPFEKNTSHLKCQAGSAEKYLLLSKLVRLYEDKDFKLSAERVLRGSSIAARMRYRLKGLKKRISTKLFKQ